MEHSLGVHIVFRAGFRWPLRAGDVVELWSGMTMLGTITAATVLSLVAHHYAAIKMQDRMRDELNAPPMRPGLTAATRKPPSSALPSRERMDALRAKRRSRKER